MRCLYNGIHPCGKCPACQLNRQRAFEFRLDQEKDEASFYLWLTLQYDDDHLPRLETGESCFDKSHCRNFFEILRKRYKSRGYKFKHFLAAEYGPNGTRRPHYHCLLFVYEENKVKTLKELFNDRREMLDFVCDKAWSYGHVEFRNYHQNVIKYLTKYMSKPELLGHKHTMKPFALISPGIGECYLDKIPPSRLQQMIKEDNFYVFYNGKQMSLPRYITDKIQDVSLEKVRETLLLNDYDSYDNIMAIRRNRVQKQIELGTQRINQRISQGIYGYEYDVRSREQITRDYKSKMLKRK